MVGRKLLFLKNQFYLVKNQLASDVPGMGQLVVIPALNLLYMKFWLDPFFLLLELLYII